MRHERSPMRSTPAPLREGGGRSLKHATARKATLGEPLQVQNADSGRPHACRRVRRDHQIIGQSALQPESRTPRTVL